MRRDAGLALAEVIVAAAVASVGALAGLAMMESSIDANAASTARTRAVGRTARVLDMLAQELVQGSVDQDDTIIRHWLIPNGIRFQRVLDVEIDTTGLARQIWSPPITYLFDAAAGTITRTPEGGVSEIVSRHVARFDVTRTPDGLVQIAVETTERGRRDTHVTHMRSLGVRPINRVD